MSSIMSDKELAAMLEQLDKEFESSATSPLHKAQFKLQHKMHTAAGSGELLIVGGTPMMGKTFLTLFAATQVRR
jgi:replicative DNA helicase